MKISLLRVRVLIKKEIRQLFRDPKTKRIIFAAPIIQLLLAPVDPDHFIVGNSP